MADESAYVPPDQRYAEATVKQFARAVRNVAAGLQDAAERVERYQEPAQSIRTLTPDFTGAAVDVLHVLTTTYANLGLSRLIQAAADAERAHAPSPSVPESTEGSERP